MPRLLGLSPWPQTVSTYLPPLSRPQGAVWALWSFGLVVAQSCGLPPVAAMLAALLDRSEARGRDPLRDWDREAAHKSGAKRGTKRRTLSVATGFAPLLRWLVACSAPTCRHLALAMDASTLGPRFPLLVIRVVVGGGAIPVAWRVGEATRPGAWRPHWAALLRPLDGRVPPPWPGRVLADRGLSAPWLFTTLQSVGWPPFLRLNRQGPYRPQGAPTLRPLTQGISRIGPRWAGPVPGLATAARHLPCTLLARWAPGDREPWLVGTALPRMPADGAGYGLRPWIEGGGKDSKRGGGHGEQTKMLAPARAERRWLALAVATLWTVSGGGQADATRPRPDLTRLPERHSARQRASQSRPSRSLSGFRRGRLMLGAALCTAQALPLGQGWSEPWPQRPTAHDDQAEEPVQRSKAA